MGSTFAALGAFAAERGIDITGQPLTVYHGHNEGIISFDPALPIPETQLDEAEGGGPIKAGHTAGGKAIKGVHTGPYAKLGDTYKAMQAYMDENGLKAGSACYEVYVSDPGDTPEKDLRTEVFWPVE
jgi:AraC family transcriptional regulator